MAFYGIAKRRGLLVTEITKKQMENIVALVTVFETNTEGCVIFKNCLY